ncbi:MAG TPA: VOC family protein [Anaerolineae bacterium]|jgi:predicted enzyme related to lactoylglutathione lyase|nr:VOC family protein [Anaerolineae bacterium]
MSSRPVHFEIHAVDPERMAAFYSELFGWTIQKWEGPMEYWMVMTGAEGELGINGGLMRRMGAAPADGAPVSAFVCTVGVEDCDASVAKAVALGGSVAMPKGPIPGMGWLAYIKDLDGNILGVMQSDEAAA